MKPLKLEWALIGTTEGFSALDGMLNVVPVYEFEDKPRWKVEWCGPSKIDALFETPTEACHEAENLAKNDLVALVKFYHEHN